MASQFMWFDVLTPRDRVDEVTHFYGQLFDGDTLPGEPSSEYRAWFTAEGQPWAAIVESGDDLSGRWLPYVHVRDLDAAVATALRAGGTVVVPRSDGPAGEAAVVADPAGSLIALWIPYPSEPTLPTPVLDSVIIASEQPQEMCDWYAGVLGGQLVDDFVVQAGQTKIIVFPHDDVEGRAPQPERLMLNFAIDDASAFQQRLEPLALTWKRPFEPEPFGLIATIEDPDGNYIQFVEQKVEAT